MPLQIITDQNIVFSPTILLNHSTYTLQYYQIIHSIYKIIPSISFTCNIRDKVSLFAGIDSSWVILEDFFELDMQSRVWTQITTDQTKPQGRLDSSLSANSDRQLVLHGGISGSGFTIELRDTWIMDLPSQTWRKYTS